MDFDCTVAALIGPATPPLDAPNHRLGPSLVLRLEAPLALWSAFARLPATPLPQAGEGEGAKVSH